MAPEESDGWGRRAGELADELRAIAEALASRRTGEDELAEALELARSLRRRLDGPPQLRWYQGEAGGAPFDPGARRAYLDQSPIRGRLNPLAPPLEVFLERRADGQRLVVGRARLGHAHEGPPHGVHGGWVAALFDDFLGAVPALNDAPAGVTAILKVRYRHVTPIEEELRFEGWLERHSARRVLARATCHAGDTLTADAEAVFVPVDFDEIRRRMRARRETAGP